MLVFIAGLMAYFSYVMSMPFLISLINDISAGKTGVLAAALETVNGLLWAIALVGALFVLARASNAVNAWRSRDRIES